MYICSTCSFSAFRKRDWERHEKNTSHPLQTDEEFESGNESDISDLNLDEAFSVPDDSEQMDFLQPEYDLHSPLVDHGPEPDPDTGNESNPPDPWFPFKSRAHFYMTVLYHGSHRRNFDQNTLRAILDVFRLYVPEEEYMPTMEDVVEYKNEFWERKLYETRNEDGNVLSFLRPEGMISLRMGNPKLSSLFDRVPRKTQNSEITTQSSAEKFKSFTFRKLGNLLVGDLVELSDVGEIVMEGYDVKIPCKIFFHIKGFYIESNHYKAEGNYFFNSSLPEMRYLRDRVEDNCYIKIRNRVGDLKFDDLKIEKTLRILNSQPTFSSVMYDERTPQLLYRMPVDQLQVIKNSLDISLQENCVQVVCNLHVDDASQVSSKMWKSASVFDVQIAGAGAGIKGNENNNMILSLTDTSKISLKRLFDGMCQEFVRLGREGFECYDSFTNKVEKVKLQVCAVFGDLPAKAEISPFIGYQADHFCSRDMYNRKTDTGSDVLRDLRTLRRQIVEIQNVGSLAGKKRLGTKFGLDINNLDSILDQLVNFDLTTDIPMDILHHFTLGWVKKSFIFLKNEILSDEALNQVCEVFDQIIWKEYKSRTNSNALRKAGSQIGRNLKAILQVVWYGLWVLIKSNPDLYRGELEIFLRAFFYLGKLNFLFYNEHEVGWSDVILTEADDSIKTCIAIFKRDMEVVVPGPKTHDIVEHLQEDIKRHGSPAGFDCQAGESKMKIQKLKNLYSNKHAPGKDVAKKYMKTEIVRHITSGGSLSEDGSERASDAVMQEAARFKSIRSILGMEEVTISVGKASLLDYVEVNGRKKVRIANPRVDHVQLGIPNQKMKTCSKIATSNGPVFRDGGLYYILDGNAPKVGVLKEVYKSDYGACYAVIETMNDVTHVTADPFLAESKMKVWKKSGMLFVTSSLHHLHSLPLLHACSAEDPPQTCRFSTDVVSVREEREVVEQRKMVYNCLGRRGKCFLVNGTALSIPPGIGFGCC